MLHYYTIYTVDGAFTEQVGKVIPRYLAAFVILVYPFGLVHNVDTVKVFQLEPRTTEPDLLTVNHELCSLDIYTSVGLDWLRRGSCCFRSRLGVYG